jgi:hypothetical protein
VRVEDVVLLLPSEDERPPGTPHSRAEYLETIMEELARYRRVSLADPTTAAALRKEFIALQRRALMREAQCPADGASCDAWYPFNVVALTALVPKVLEEIEALLVLP